VGIGSATDVRVRVVEIWIEKMKMIASETRMSLAIEKERCCVTASDCSSVSEIAVIEKYYDREAIESDYHREDKRVNCLIVIQDNEGACHV
jgi:hypothetical protein